MHHTTPNVIPLFRKSEFVGYNRLQFLY